MQWGTNLTYWRTSGLPLGYDNFTTAWVLGGDQIVFDGHGVGTFDGNGQLWLVYFPVNHPGSGSDFTLTRYNLANGVSNLPGRPISLMISNSTNSHYTGIRFVQSQFWTMAIKDSEDVLLENIYINSTSNNSVRLHSY